MPAICNINSTSLQVSDSFFEVEALMEKMKQLQECRDEEEASQEEMASRFEIEKRESMLVFSSGESHPEHGHRASHTSPTCFYRVSISLKKQTQCVLSGRLLHRFSHSQVVFKEGSRERVGSADSTRVRVEHQSWIYWHSPFSFLILCWEGLAGCAHATASMLKSDRCQELALSFHHAAPID